MVFFTCNACGQAIKKAQVEKHYQQQCRNCEVLSCMDCGKDFYGDDYKQHTQCISEDQKYGGKGYQAPQNANKGEAKQEQWLQRVREAVQAGNVSTNIKNLLDQIAEYPNIPRKRGKFENFVRNSLKVHNPKTIEQVWNVFSAATAKPDTSKSTPPLPKETGTASSKSLPDGGSNDGAMKETVKENAEEKKGKDKKSSKRSESSKSGQEITVDNTESGKSKRKVKRASKHSESSENVHENASHGVNARTKEKTKRKKNKTSESEDAAKDDVIVGEKVKAKKKITSKHKNESTYGSMSDAENNAVSPSKNGKKGTDKQNKKVKKKTKDSKSDRFISYSDGEVSFELKLKAEKGENKEDDQPKLGAIEDTGTVNTGSSSAKGTAKKSKEKKKGKVVDSSKTNGVLTPSVMEVSSELEKKGRKSKKSRANEQAADRDENVKESEKRDIYGVDVTAKKKKKKHLKRKGDNKFDTAVVNKKAKLSVNNDMKKDTKNKKKKKPDASDKLTTSDRNNETFLLVNGSLDNKKTKKKIKIGKQLSAVKGKGSNSSKGDHKHANKHTTSEKRKKKIPLNKHLSPCKTDISTSTDESGKDLMAKSKKCTGKDKKDIELHTVESGLKKTSSRTKKKSTSDKPSSDMKGESTSPSSPQHGGKVKAATQVSKDSDKDASKGGINGKTKKKAKVSPTTKAEVMKGTKKKSKESLGVVFRSKRSKSSNITSFELIGNQIVVHVRKDRTREHMDVQQGDKKVLPDSSAEADTPGEKVEKTSMKTSARKIKKKQSSDEGDQGQSGEANGGGDAAVKEKKKKKRKHEETDPQSGNESVDLTEPSQGIVKKTSAELLEPSPKKVKKTSKEKVKETSVETSAEKIKKNKKRKTSEESPTAKAMEPATESSTETIKKKKKKKKPEVSKDEDQKSPEVKTKKEKKKRKFDETIFGLDDKSLMESSPEKVKKVSVEPSTEKAKKKKKKQLGCAGDHVPLSEINGGGKAGKKKKKKKKTKSKRKETVSGNEPEVTNNKTALTDIPGGDSPKRKKKKKSKESAVTSDVMSKADTPGIDRGKKKKKKSKKEKPTPGSEKESPVKNGTKSKLQEDGVVKSVGLENGLGSVKVKKAKKGAKKSKGIDPNNNPMSFSTTLPIQKSVNMETKSKSEKLPNKKKKSHKKDKSKELSDMLGVAEAKAKVKKLKKTKKVKVR